MATDNGEDDVKTTTDTPSTLSENFKEFAEKLGAGINTFKQSVESAIKDIDNTVENDIRKALGCYWAREDDEWAGGDKLESLNQLDAGEITYVYYNNGLKATQDLDVFTDWIKGYKVANGNNESSYSIDVSEFLNTEDLYVVDVISFSASKGGDGDMFPCAVWHNDNRIIAAWTSGSTGETTRSQCSVLTGLTLRLTSTTIRLTGNDVSSSGGFGWSAISFHRISY